MHVVEAYRAAEKVVIPLPARERLGPGIVAGTRPADPAHGKWDEQPEYVVKFFATRGHLPFLVGGHNDDTLQKMSHCLSLAAAGHPSLLLGSLQTEMDNSLYRDGNFRATLMFAHSASEMLADTALMAMLFEEGKTPEEATGAFAKPLKTRIITEYHDRIGGAWNSRGSGIVAQWISNLLLTRHRVTHAGYLPRHEEACAAREAHFSLGRHLRDRLAGHTKDYPFTAGLLVASGGFQRRGIETKASERALRIGNEKMPEFVAWRDAPITLRA